MRADLHFHSRFSDGNRWPYELAAAAKSAGMEAVALTDHDNLAGTAEFIAEAGRLGMRAWAATEIDCVDAEIGYKSEILAYFPSGNFSRTEALLAPVRRERRSMVKALFASAAQVFSREEINFKEYERERLSGRPSGSRPIGPEDLRYGKTDIFIALQRLGTLAPGVGYRKFKKRYLKTGLLQGTDVTKLQLSDICGAVLADGGHLSVPHIAHEFDDDPDVMSNRLARLDRLMERFRVLGIDAIELYDYGHKRRILLNQIVAKRAMAHGFYLTYGSDDHGLPSGKRGVGLFHGDFAGFPG